MVAAGFPGEYSCPISVTQTSSGRAHPPCTHPRRPQARDLRSPPRRRSPRSLLWRGPSAPAPPEPFPSHSFLLRVPFLSPPCHPPSLLPSFPRALPSLSESRRLRLFQADPPSRPPRSAPSILSCSRPPGSSPEETPLPSSLFSLLEPPLELRGRAPSELTPQRLLPSLSRASPGAARPAGELLLLPRFLQVPPAGPVPICSVGAELRPCCPAGLGDLDSLVLLPPGGLMTLLKKESGMALKLCAPVWGPSPLGFIYSRFCSVLSFTCS